jgi:HAD superfamily hydrolase (TIGR01509 family)
MSDWPAAVIFDFDGVLVNSEPLHFEAFREVLAAEHLGLTEDEYYRELIGFDDAGAFRHIYQVHGIPLTPKVFLSLMTRKSQAMMTSIRNRRFSALPGVEQFVRSLWRKYPLAICSGALREEIEAMLEGISLRDCFSVIVAAEDVPVGKPDPMGYLLSIKQLSAKLHRPLKPANCLVVEDAPSVIHTVKKEGFRVIGVATSYPLEKLTEADWQVKTLEPDVIRKAIPELALE